MLRGGRVGTVGAVAPVSPRSRGAITSVMNDALRTRLHSLAERPVERDVAAMHLDRMVTVRPRRRLPQPALLVAATIAVAGTATAFGVALGGPAPGRVTTVSAPDAVGTPPLDRPGPPGATTLPAGSDEAFSCFGPPPFAAVPPESEEARAAEAEAFSEFRETQCGALRDGNGPVPPHTGPCSGPPPYAEIEPIDGSARAAEGTDFTRLRAACQGDGTATTTTTLGSATNAALPPSVSVPAGSPDSVPTGPPPGVPGEADGGE